MSASEYDTIAKYYSIEDNMCDDIPMYLSFAEKYGAPVLDLGCGAGRVSIALARKGFDVWCLDISKELLDIARKKVKNSFASKTHFVRADMRDFNLSIKFNLAIIANNTFLHLLSEYDQRSALTNIIHHLSEKGILVIDIFNPDQKMLGQDAYFFKNNQPIKHENSLIIVSSYGKTIFDKQMIRVRKRYIEYKNGIKVNEITWSFYLRYMYKDELEDLLKAIGFKVIKTLGDYLGASWNANSKRIIIIARK